MKIALRSIPAAASLALLAACGGSGNAALSKTFTYGAAQAPSSSESSATSSAQTNLSAAAGFSAHPDMDKGTAIFGFATALADGALGSATYGMAHPGPDDISRGLRRAGNLNSACVTATSNSVSFNNCSVSEAGYNVTLNGSITATADSVTWGITAGFSGTDQGYTINISMHYSGTMTVTASKITGNGLFDIGGSISGNGQSANFGMATAAIVDLTYQSSPSFCVTSGSVEVKRVWTARPSGASASQLKDAAVKITWTGCNAFTVAHSQ
jgi:hypothetical protein